MKPIIQYYKLQSLHGLREYFQRTARETNKIFPVRFSSSEKNISLKFPYKLEMNALT